MDVQTLDDDSLFADSDHEDNNNNNNNNRNSSNNNNNNNNEIITSADYSDWDDDDEVIHESGNVGYYGNSEEDSIDASQHADSDRGKNVQLPTFTWSIFFG